MGALFWIKRFVLAAAPLAAILAAVERFKGTTTKEDYLSAIAWALIAAAIFTYAGWRRYRHAKACGMCDDLAAARKARKTT